MGIALDIAEQLGAPVESLHDGWWMPMTQVPGDRVDGRAYPRGLVRKPGLPRSIIVNTAGRRSIDEASPYHEFGKGMHQLDENGGTRNRVAFMIFDEGFRRRHPFPGLTASGPLAEHIIAAPSLAELASQVGVDANALENTVARWNEFPAEGVDQDFHRGENVYDGYYGDPWQDGNGSLGPIADGPFYAKRTYSGSIGSKGGLTTDMSARLLGAEGPVARLHAVGNSAAFWPGDG